MSYENTKAWRERQDPEQLRAYRAEESRKWRAAHPDKAKEIRDRYRAKNRDRIRELDRKAQGRRRKADPEAQRRRNQTYIERQRQARIAKAGREPPPACELCGTVASVVFDHCHACGAFRGWLCDRCNRVLGVVEEDADLLRKMIAYLEASHARKDDSETSAQAS